MLKVLVFGAGGHGKVILDILNRMPGMEVAFIGDDRESLDGTTMMGIPVVAPRAKVLRCAQEQGIGSVIGAGVTIGQGSVVMAGAIINVDTRIGQNAIVNTGARIDRVLPANLFELAPRN